MGMVSTAEGLLRFVLAHPDEWGPRLVFADWLEEERLHDRANLIRWQIEENALNAAIDGHLGRPDKAHLFKEFEEMIQGRSWRRGRVRELLTRENRAAWASPLKVVSNGGYWRKGMKNIPVGDCEFRRGFIESVTVAWKVWDIEHAHILAHHPVRKATLFNVPPAVTPDRLRERWPDIRFPGRSYVLPGGSVEPTLNYEMEVAAVRPLAVRAGDYLELGDGYPFSHGYLRPSGGRPTGIVVVTPPDKDGRMTVRIRAGDAQQLLERLVQDVR